MWSYVENNVKHNDVVKNVVTLMFAATVPINHPEGKISNTIFAAKVKSVNNNYDYDQSSNNEIYQLSHFENTIFPNTNLRKN